MRFLLTCLLLLFSVTGVQATQRPINSQAQKGTVCYTDSLLAPSSTDTLTVIGYSPTVQPIREITFSIQVININTSVTLRLVGGISPDKMGNLDAGGTDTVITSNGVYNFRFTGVTSMGAFALLFVSEAGGNNAKLYITAKAG